MRHGKSKSWTHKTKTMNRQTKPIPAKQTSQEQLSLDSIDEPSKPLAQSLAQPFAHLRADKSYRPNQSSKDQSSKNQTSRRKLDDLIREGWVKQDQIWQASSIHSETYQTTTDSTDGATRSTAHPESMGGVSTGYETLDQQLPNRGWPARGLTELLHHHPGIGEIRLLTPALATLSQAQNRWIVWVSPPYIPYAPALVNAGVDLKKILVVTPDKLSDKLWVLEKAMASGSCSAVLAWPEKIQYKQLRRLQIASKTGDCFAVVFRSGHATKQSSPAELRIRLDSHQDDSAISDQSVLNIEILKRKGGWPTATFPLRLNDKLNQMTPEFHELPISQWREKRPELVYMEHLARDQHVLQ